MKKGEEVRTALKVFKGALLQHLIDEEGHFYTYMKYLIRAEKRSNTVLKGFKEEMTGIRKAIFAFIDKSLELDAQYDAEFLDNLNVIGAALVKRIEAEERDLYTLFRPAES